MGTSSGSKSSQARLREALTAGGPVASKGPPVADGVLSVTPDTAEAVEWRSRTSVVDAIASASSFLDDGDDGEAPPLHCPASDAGLRIDGPSYTPQAAAAQPSCCHSMAVNCCAAALGSKASAARLPRHSLVSAACRPSQQRAVW